MKSAVFSRRRLIVGFVLGLILLIGAMGVWFVQNQRNNLSGSPLSVEIVNEYDSKKLHLNSTQTTMIDLAEKISAFDLWQTQQKITLHKGIPDYSYGKFLRGDRIQSASMFKMDQGTVVVDIYLDEGLTEYDLIYEVTQNYYWSILALNTYLLSDPDSEISYSEAHSLVHSLIIQNADENAFPFSIANKP